MVREDRSADRELPSLPDLRPLVAWFELNRRDFNWRETNEPYRVWVSEVMSQQTRAETIAAYFSRFMEAFPTVEALADADEHELLKVWEGLGYYSRARNLQKAARIIVAEYGGKLPTTAAELVLLPGIGPYTAGAIASFCFGEAVPAVDGNVVRITSRLLDLDFTQGDTKDRKTTETILAAYMAEHPDQDPAAINESFMTLGATVCIPRTPRCTACPMAEVCLAKRSGREGLLPYKKTSRKNAVEAMTYLILENSDGRYLLGRRPTGLLHGLWQPIALDGQLTEDEIRLRLDDMGFHAISVDFIAARKHLFSHLTWELDIWHVKLGEINTGDTLLSETGVAYIVGPELDDLNWYTPEQARSFAFSSALADYLPWS